MNLQIGEMEIDDIAFLTGNENHHPPRKNSGKNCGSLCVTSSRRRYHKTYQSPLLIGLISFTVFLLTALFLLLAFTNPFKDHCDQTSLNDLTSTSSNSLSSSSGSSNKNSQSQFITKNGKLFPWREIKLPSYQIPIHYDLFMHPNLTTFKNKGTIDITFMLNETTDYIVIHIRDLNISDINLVNSNEELIGIKELIELPVYDFLLIKFERLLETKYNNYSMKINFQKNLEEKLEGFYISSHIDSNTNKKRYIATTHFEPISARSAFPCFDEPQLKATFSLKMVHEPYHEVYFNSEQQTKILYNMDGLQLTVFEDTLPMSTYLVAFVICDFKSLSARTKEGLRVRIIVPNDQYNQAEHALYTATTIISYFQEFFNINYPLPKLDLIAVPDFGAGAMENWGLITFRTTAILFDEQISSSDAKEQVSIVISHELAHQWFGNLVTMEWWNDLWLNEGFASFMENLGVDFVNPEWRMMEQFSRTTQDALELDSLDSSHPVLMDIKDPRDIEALFDTISYKKGASLIRMLQTFLSMNILRLGLSHYLNAFAFKNAETKDLWKSFSDVVPNSSINVTVVMERWIKQKGFPLINVKSDKNKIYLTQKRFLSSPQYKTEQLSNEDSEDDEDIPPFAYQWIIPITLISSRNYRAHRLVWFSSTSTSITLDYGAEWFKINVNQTGFYRVNYDEKNWWRLIKVLHQSDYNYHILPPSDRANLIDDAFTLMKVNQLSPDIAFNLTLYLEVSERDLLPWQTAIKHFDHFDSLMLSSPYLYRYVRRLLQPVLATWGWKDEGNHLTRKLRALLFYSALMYGDEQTKRIASRFFNEWMQNSYNVPSNLKQIVITTGIKFGGRKEWQFVWNKYKTSKVASEQRLLLKSLTQTQSVWQLNELLNYSLNKDLIKRQDTIQVITDISRNPLARYMAWRFVRENWPLLLKLFGQGSFSMDALISQITESFSTEFDLNEVKTFFSNVQVGSGKLALKQSIERIRANIFWKQNVEQKVISWLQKVQYRN